MRIARYKKIELSDIESIAYKGNNKLAVCYNMTDNNFKIIVPENASADDIIKCLIAAHCQVMSFRGASTRQIRRQVKKEYCNKKIQGMENRFPSLND